jgi:3-hydroxy-9,10-secoandrosta-1,3,5(10)-triene-9,17-dione monooxygenase reductase component
MAGWHAPEPDAMKRALGALPTGVTIITFRDDENQPAGMTANAFCSVSLSPPLILVCINRASRTAKLVLDRKQFGVSILDEGQRAIAEFCARPGYDKRLDDRWIVRELGSDGPPVVLGAMSHFNCEVDAVHEAGTHAIIVGRVRHIALGEGGEPLAYFRGAYRRLDPAPERRVEAMWDLLERSAF